MRRGFLVVVAGAALAVNLTAKQGFAQSSDETSRAAARKLGYAGVEAFEAGNIALASEKLEKAYAVLKVPSLGLWSARALAKQGKLIQAAERYVEVSRLPIAGDAAVQKKAQADAQQELEATQAAIPSLVVRIEGADPGRVTLTLDGVAVSSQLVGEAVPVNPGEHTVLGVVGDARAERRVTLQERDQKQVVLTFDAAPASSEVKVEPAGTSDQPPSDRGVSSGGSTRKTLGWIAIGVGAAGLVVGGVTAGLAASKKSALDDNPSCADRICPRALNDDVDSYNTMRSVSTVGFIAGGVLAATGVVLVLTAPRTPAATALVVSPSSLQLRGQF